MAIKYIRLLSDLHREFDNRTFLPPPLPEDHETVLVLAGDIDVGKRTAHYAVELAERFAHVIWVNGNHEYYKENLGRLQSKMKEIIKDVPNVHFLDGESVTLDGIHFIGATLWTDLDKGNPILRFDAENTMNDCKKIRWGTQYRKFKSTAWISAHLADKQKLVDELRAAQGQDYRARVVITHHLPSWAAIHSQFRGNKLNGCYAANLDEVINEFQPDYWFFGHQHNSTHLAYGDTQLISNPRGYHGVELNRDFDPVFRIEI